MQLREKIAHDLSRLLSTPAFWFVASSAVAATLQILPIAAPQQWKGDVKQGWNFGATAACLAIAAATSGKMERDVTEIRVRNRMGHQFAVDEMVDIVNLQRAATAAKIRLLNGCFTQGEIQQQMGQIMAMLKGAYMGQPLLEASADLPVEDLAESLATATNSGTLIIAPSGCGKTSLLRNAIVAADAHYSSEVDFQVIDCKGEAYWCGLEKSPNDYTLLDDDRAKDGFQALQLIKGRFSAASPQFPTIAIIDEWNNGVASLQNSPDLNRDEKNRAVSATRQIVTKGRSKRVFGWLTTHTPKTDQIGLDASTRQSLNIIILGRLNKIGLIGAILKGGKFDFVDDDEQRESLLQQYQAYVKSPSFNPQIPIALTNLAGEWRLVKLPHYSDRPSPIKKSVLNSPAADLLGDESEVQRLEQLFQQEAEHPIEEFYHTDVDEDLVQFFTEDSKQKSALSTPAQSILDKYIQKEMNGQYITASWVKNFAFRSKELSQISPDEIRRYFAELVETGYGAIAGEGSQLAWGMVAE